MALHYDSEIDGFDRKNEQLLIRDRNITSMLRGSFPSNIYYLLTGREIADAKKFDDYLLHLQGSKKPADQTFAEHIDALGLETMAKLAAGCLYYHQQDPEAEDFETLDREDTRFLYLLSKLPAVIGGRPPAENGGTFTAEALDTMRGRNSDKNEQEILELVLNSFIGGFGYFAPTTFLPRNASSTGAKTGACLAAGICANGKYHIGAIGEVMQIMKEWNGKNEEEIIAGLKTKVEKEAFPGFGHPLFKIDPRVKYIRNILREQNVENRFVEIFDICADYFRKTRNIYPNIDAVNATALLTLGFEPAHGPCIFAFGRLAAMYAHTREERKHKPYHVFRKSLGLWTLLPKCFFNKDFDKINRFFKKYLRRRL